MGYRTKARTRELVCDVAALAPEEGCEPLTVTVRSNLTWDEVEALPAFATTADGVVSFPNAEELRKAIAPCVLAWNCEAVNPKTGAMEPVPAPADGGPDGFRAVDDLLLIWLGVTIKRMHRAPFGDGSDEAQKKDTAPSGDTPPPSPGPSSSSETPPRSSRKNRKGSPAR